MDVGDLETVPAEVDALTQALDSERGRYVAGVEREPTLAHLFAEWPRAAHRATVTALRDAGQAALADRVAALRAERAAAGYEEDWRAAEVTAQAVGPDGPAGLHALELAALREADPTRRQAFARAAAEALSPSAALAEAMVEARARAGAEVGLAPDWPAVVLGDTLLGTSDDAYRDVLAFRARAELGLAPVPGGNLSRADLLHLLRLARWGGLFTPSALDAAVRAMAADLRLDLARVRVDEGDRPAQWPGAHVSGSRLSFRRRGGAGDWQDLLDALGRAVAAAHAPPHRRDPLLGPALGWLLGTLLLEPRWLRDHADVERKHAADVVRELALRRLFALRARAAALRVASEAQRGLAGARWRETYREALTAATGATWEGVRAARDADAAAHRAALLGAGVGGRLRDEVRERFDEDWWRNPRTTEFLAGLLAAGALPDEGDDPDALAPARAAHALVEKMA
jgi:hypothetical protein